MEPNELAQGLVERAQALYADARKLEDAARVLAPDLPQLDPASGVLMPSEDIVALRGQLTDALAELGQTQARAKELDTQLSLVSGDLEALRAAEGRTQPGEERGEDWISVVEHNKAIDALHATKLQLRDRIEKLSAELEEAQVEAWIKDELRESQAAVEAQRKSLAQYQEDLRKRDETIEELESALDEATLPVDRVEPYPPDTPEQAKRAREEGQTVAIEPAAPKGRQGEHMVQVEEENRREIRDAIVAQAHRERFNLRELSDATGIPRGTIQNHIAYFVEKGMIVKVGTRGPTSGWRYVPPLQGDQQNGLVTS